MFSVCLSVHTGVPPGPVLDPTSDPVSGTFWGREWSGDGDKSLQESGKPPPPQDRICREWYISCGQPR